LNSESERIRLLTPVHITMSCIEDFKFSFWRSTAAFYYYRYLFQEVNIICVQFIGYRYTQLIIQSINLFDVYNCITFVSKQAERRQRTPRQTKSALTGAQTKNTIIQ